MVQLPKSISTPGNYSDKILQNFFISRPRRTYAYKLTHSRVEGNLEFSFNMKILAYNVYSIQTCCLVNTKLLQIRLKCQNFPVGHIQLAAWPSAGQLLDMPLLKMDDIVMHLFHHAVIHIVFIQSKVLPNSTRIDTNLYKNSQAVKKGCGPQKARVKKRCEIQGSGQEMAVMVGLMAKKINEDTSGEFVLPSPASNSPELSLLKFLPTISVISWLPPSISHLFSPWLFRGPHSFFTAWLFLYRYQFFVFLYSKASLWPTL